MLKSAKNVSKKTNFWWTQAPTAPRQLLICATFYQKDVCFFKWLWTAIQGFGKRFRVVWGPQKTSPEATGQYGFVIYFRFWSKKITFLKPLELLKIYDSAHARCRRAAAKRGLWDGQKSELAKVSWFFLSPPRRPNYRLPARRRFPLATQ